MRVLTHSVCVYECKRQSMCKGGLRGRLVSTAAQSQPKQATVRWHRERASVCVCVYLTVCVSALSSHPFCPDCSKNNPLLRIFNPQVTALSSLIFCSLSHPRTFVVHTVHSLSLTHTHTHTHTLTHTCRDGVRGGSSCVKPAKTQA